MTLVDGIERLGGALVALVAFGAVSAVLFSLVAAAHLDTYTKLLILFCIVVIPLAAVIYIFRDKVYS
jgi:hypothetical protein